MTSWWVLAGWTLGWVLLWRLPRLSEPLSNDQGSVTVSVVIPARNEADRLPTLLASLAAQDCRPDQVVVVDDGSTDATAAIATTFAGVEVIETPPLPEGWAGKPWACATGARAATGSLLIFLDADVRLAPPAIGSLITSWARQGGLLSVQPHHHIRRAVETLSLPFNIVSLMGLGIGSLVPPTRQWGAAGPCLVTSRPHYDQIGGHGAVAGEVAEDLALAERYQAAGLPLRCVGGHDVVSYRMYRNVGDLVEGWSKNLAIGASRTPLLRSMAVTAWITTLLVLAWSLRSVPTTSEEFASWAMAYGAGAVQLGLLGRRVGRFGPAVLAWPLLVVAFVAVFVRSMLRTVVQRRVRWSGRELAIVRRR